MVNYFRRHVSYLENIGVKEKIIVASYDGR